MSEDMREHDLDINLSSTKNSYYIGDEELNKLLNYKNSNEEERDLSPSPMSEGGGLGHKDRLKDVLCPQADRILKLEKAFADEKLKVHQLLNLVNEIANVVFETDVKLVFERDNDE